MKSTYTNMKTDGPMKSTYTTMKSSGPMKSKYTTMKTGGSLIDRIRKCLTSMAPKLSDAWTKFRLLTWKNFLQQRRHRWQTAVEVLLPVVTMALVQLLRWQIEPYFVDTAHFPPLKAYSLDPSLGVLYGMNHSDLRLAYSPRNEILESVVRNALINVFVRNAHYLKQAYPDVDLPVLRNMDEIMKHADTGKGLNTSGDMDEIMKHNDTLKGLNTSGNMDEIMKHNDTLKGLNTSVNMDEIMKHNDTLKGLNTSANMDEIMKYADILKRLNTSGNMDEIMKYADILKRLTSSGKVDAYKNSAQLQNIYADEKATRIVIAAVEFPDELSTATVLPKDISFSVRFPERPRMNAFFGSGGPTWRTDAVFPHFSTPGPRYSFSWEGGIDPGYIHEMFLSLQHSIAMELIIEKTGQVDLRHFEVYVNRYPYPAQLIDLAVTTLSILIPMFILVSFSYTAVNIITAVTVEKELQLKETMKVMGLPSWLHWTAWFVKQFVFLLFVAVFIIIGLKIACIAVWEENAMEDKREFIISKIPIFTTKEGYRGHAVFTNTPWTVLLFFLLLYMACMIFFCFMISGFFSIASTAALFGGIIWFVTYIPAVMLSVELTLSSWVQALSCLCINSAMSYGFQLLINAECTGGLQWGQFFTSPAEDSGRFLFGHVVLMLVLDCVIYMLVALYLEQVLPGPYGTPQPWNFLCKKKFWRSSSKNQDDTKVPMDDKTSKTNIVKQDDPTNHKIGVQISELTKIFGQYVAVNKLSLNIYEDQITVLLGHNGAGKTTTISMLTGNLKITQGSVNIAGYDMASQGYAARSLIGLCPQHNVLFNELTVREHLEFFGRLKGLKGSRLKEDIDVMIEKLELQEKSNYQASGLSGGQKRRLCVGIALSGNTRVVLLDEPTSGMDPASRRALWDLLEKEKKGRSMILTTHFMDEADILGDRVAIMTGGRLQCVGSPYFLKHHYGVGYTLVVVKDEGFQPKLCTDLINRYIPGTTIKEDRGTEVTYTIKNEYSHTFEAMLSDLESNKNEIKYTNYGLVATSLEDVFLSVGSEDHSKLKEPEDVDSSTDTSKMDVTKDLVTGVSLWRQHVLAIWLKLWLMWTRSWQLLLLQLAVPAILMIAFLGVMRILMGMADDIFVKRHLSLEKGFRSTETLLNFNGTDKSSTGALAKEAYQNVFTESAAKNPSMSLTVVENTVLLGDYYLQRVHNVHQMNIERTRLLIGATFSDKMAVAWFSCFGYHDIAVSLAAVHAALLRAYEPDATLKEYNHPLDAQYRDSSNMQMLFKILSMQVSNGIGSSIGIMSAVFIMFYIKERTSNAKLLQRAAGINPATMWLSAAVFDYVWFFIISLFLPISCAIFQVIGLSTFAEILTLQICVMAYAAAMLPMIYCLSHCFNLPAFGFVAVFFLNLMCLLASLIVRTLQLLKSNAKDVARIIDYIMQFFPLYSLISVAKRLNDLGLQKLWCLRSCGIMSALNPHETECNMKVMCKWHPDRCCVADNPYWQWERPGILRYFVAMLVTCIVLWVILMLQEFGIYRKIFHRERVPPPIDESTQDEDVVNEANYARDIASSPPSNVSLVANGLSKYYKKYLAVNQVSFTVGSKECFGLLGVNGAGKTTTFKMLMGDESISSGDAYISGYSVRKNITKVYEYIGYCPQFDAVFGDMTGRQNLRFFSSLRGIPPQQAHAKIDALAHTFGFFKHLDKKVDNYSGGNKRKLSTAVALLGRTHVIFVDEPTTGVDPAARRQMWDAISAAQQSGRGFVLTSHSMEECEALCSRLTIMVNGRFQCLGTPQHLKNKFSEGFTLTVKMAHEDEDALSSIDRVKEYINANFKSPKLMEEHQGLLTYYLPDRSMAWSAMFGVMERAKHEFRVEDYSISQTTLEQIFLQFTKYQKEEAD